MKRSELTVGKFYAVSKTDRSGVGAITKVKVLSQFPYSKRDAWSRVDENRNVQVSKGNGVLVEIIATDYKTGADKEGRHPYQDVVQLRNIINEWDAELAERLEWEVRREAYRKAQIEEEAQRVEFKKNYCDPEMKKFLKTLKEMNNEYVSASYRLEDLKFSTLEVLNEALIALAEKKGVLVTL
jgi:hypothetical protein